MARNLEDAVNVIFSAYPSMMVGAVSAWKNFAQIASAASDELARNSSGVLATRNAHYTAPYGEKLVSPVQWLRTISTQSETVAEHISSLKSVGDQAQTKASTALGSRNTQVEQLGTTTGTSSANAAEHRALMQKQADEAAAQVINQQIDTWAGKNRAFRIPGVPPITQRTGGSGGSENVAQPGGTSAVQSAAALAIASATATDPTLHGHGSPGRDQLSVIGSHPDQPGGRPINPIDGNLIVDHNGGDFKGWFKDPNTGFYIDPATGREYDPNSQRWIDPVTGKPFGAGTRYAARLDGLGGGGTGGPTLAGAAGGGGTGGPTLAGAAGASTSGGLTLAGVSGGGTSGGAGGTPLSSSAGGSAPHPGSGGGGGGTPLSISGGAALESGGAAAGLGGIAAGGGGATPLSIGGGGLGAGGGSGAAMYGGAIPPSLALSNPASSALRLKARDNMAAKGYGARLMVDRERSLAAGRTPYLPAMQAGMGGAGAVGSSKSGGRAGAMGAAGQSRRRSYLPPMQAGGASVDKRAGKRRPAWLQDDDPWAAALDAVPAVLGEES